MKTIAIYHKDCSDGTTAAAVVLRKFPNALLFPLSHGFESIELEPIMKIAKIGDSIFTVDCALGAREFLKAGFTVTSIDHHVGGETEYKELAKQNSAFTFIFDNNKSGASLTWDYFFPDEKKPEIIKLVEDRDLWRWKYGEKTKNVGYSLHMFMNKPEEVLKFFDDSLEKLEKEGSVISGFMKTMIDHSVEKTEPIVVHIGNYNVPFYNITVNKSESGNLIATKVGKAVGLFTIDGDSVTISFRSLDGQSPSALELSKAVGAGGHKNASGAKMKLSDFIKSIIV
jgi:oligoribonuclease NrnB/cAMP/cGMP phosphodiesterase (DHH superfamily)